jgi:hypothetical protein
MVLLLQSFPLFVETGKRHSTVVHLLHKRVINMICLLVPVFDWPNIMIGLGGLLHKRVINMICLLVPVFDWPNIMIGLGGLL